MGIGHGALAVNERQVETLSSAGLTAGCSVLTAPARPCVPHTGFACFGTEIGNICPRSFLFIHTPGLHEVGAFCNVFWHIVKPEVAPIIVSSITAVLVMNVSLVDTLGRELISDAVFKLFASIARKCIELHHVKGQTNCRLYQSQSCFLERVVCKQELGECEFILYHLQVSVQ